ncbi:NADPH-dependent FMN reductase [Jiella sp. M17.18]|uniref:NADPH-dependent FMN reductase n=1 Tax=Jiella sp. M17.18 TaxID=3234247 RepID=UPI0034DE2FDB
MNPDAAAGEDHGPCFLAICGSLRKISTNRALLEAFERHAPRPIQVEIAPDIGVLPPFNPDREGSSTPVEVTAFAQKIRRSHGIVIAAPEYAHGIPGALKNALDWLVSRSEIPGKPVMLVHASTRGSFVREHLTEVLRTMSVRLFDAAAFELHLIGRTPEEARSLLDTEEQIRRIRATMEAFAAFASRMAEEQA